MARIDWMVVCDMAYFDRLDRLCIVGITQKFVFPRLPVGLHQIMVVAHLVDIEPEDEISVRVSLDVPDGLSGVVPLVQGQSVQVDGEYVLATLRDVPFTQEGTYRFGVSIGDAAPSVAEICVWAYSGSAGDVH